MSTIQHINDNSKPLIFLGTNLCLGKYIDICAAHNIEIHGIIDGDYYGNRDDYEGISIIDSDQGLLDNANYYRDNFNFFCATNWGPEPGPAPTRNRDKRFRQIDLLDNLNLNVISLLDPWVRLASTAQVGRGCFIDSFSVIESHCVIEDYVNIYSFVDLGHHTRVDRNSYIQRHCGIGSNMHFKKNCYLSVGVKALKTRAVFGENTFVHECMYIRRGTVPNEIIGVNGSNMSRVYSFDDCQIDE